MCCSPACCQAIYRIHPSKAASGYRTLGCFWALIVSVLVGCSGDAAKPKHTADRQTSAKQTAQPGRNVPVLSASPEPDAAPAVSLQQAESLLAGGQLGQAESAANELLIRQPGEPRVIFLAANVQARQ